MLVSILFITCALSCVGCAKKRAYDRYYKSQMMPRSLEGSCVYLQIMDKEKKMGNSGLVASIYRIISARLYAYTFFNNRSNGSAAMQPTQSRQFLQEKDEEYKILEQEVQDLQRKLEANKRQQSKVQANKEELQTAEQELQTQLDQKKEALERKKVELR